MLNAFSMASTLKRKGRLPSAAPSPLNRSITLCPISSGCAERWSDSFSWSGVSRRREGEVWCVPIHSYDAVEFQSAPILCSHHVTYLCIRGVFVELETRYLRRRGELSDLGGESNLPPVVLLGCWDDFEYGGCHVCDSFLCTHTSGFGT